MRGLRARGGLVVDLSWREGSLTAVQITASAEEQTVTVRHGAHQIAVDLPATSTVRLTGTHLLQETQT